MTLSKEALAEIEARHEDVEESGWGGPLPSRPALADDAKRRSLARSVMAHEDRATLLSEIRTLQSEVEKMRGALDRASKVAALLLQNSIGCAVNHYGNDHELHGLPGWLNDAESEIQDIRALTSKATP